MNETIVEILTRQNKQLREKVAELEETIRQMHELQRGAGDLPTWLPHLTRTQESFLRALRDSRQEVASRDYLMQAIYEAKYENVTPDVKIIDVMICKLRRKLRGTGVEILTNWGRGYHLTAETKALLNGVRSPLTFPVVEFPSPEP